MSHSLHLSIENNDRGLAGAGEKIAEFLLAAGVSEEMTHDIRLAAEELLTNICKYAYVDVDEHSILLDISVGADGATLRLSDDGMEFNPLNAAPPDFSIPLEERPIGGLGIHIVRSLAEKIEYARAAGRNVLELFFRPGCHRDKE
jgi:anti-sigma regulatory factor (Ser/Thr protein kinase)